MTTNTVTLSLSLYIYIYIYVYVCVCVCVCVCLSVSNFFVPPKEEATTFPYENIYLVFIYESVKMLQ